MIKTESMSKNYSISDIIKYPCEGVSDEDTEKVEKLADAAPLMYQEHNVNKSHCETVIDMINKKEYESAINLLIIMIQNSEKAIKKATE